MSDNIRILKNYLLYFLLMILVCIIGISNVLAEEVDEGYITDKTTILYENNNAQAMVSLPVNTNVNQYLYNILVLLINNQTFTKDYLYQIELLTPNAKIKNINNIYIVGGTNNTTTCQAIGLDSTDANYPKIYFKCPTTVRDLTIGLNNDSPTTSSESITTSNNFRWNYAYLRYFTEDDDIDLGPVISNATNNTNNIINNNNQNTQDIINNQNTNNQTIINNNNQNTNKIIEENKKNFNDCHDSVNLINNIATNQTINGLNVVVNNDKTITINGTATATTDITIVTSMILKSGIYTLSGTPSTGGSSTYKMQLLRAGSTRNEQGNGLTFTTTEDYNNVGLIIKVYNGKTLNNITFKPQLEKGSIATSYEPYGEEICVNKLDEQKNAINGLTSSLTDSSPVDMSSLGDTAGWLPAGPIDSIINLPLNLFNNLLVALNGTCQPLNIPLPYVDKNLLVPCISTIFNQIDGLPNFWNWVGVITSVVILYRYLLSLYKYYDDLTTLKANFISDFGGAP